VQGSVFELKVVSHFAAAHQLTELGGPCERLHGHNWKIEVFVRGTEVGKDGLLIDFKVLKAATEKVLQELDHRFLNELQAFKEESPSSENIAKYIYQSLARDVEDDRVKVARVTAWESDSACATYLMD
jgi:6-pyruvoyltetrahydropterin/6-carboxytetrahydropterin synthase